jgi:hypothetical protein
MHGPKTSLHYASNMQLIAMVRCVVEASGHELLLLSYREREVLFFIVGRRMRFQAFDAFLAEITFMTISTAVHPQACI